jgi:hypothetical protein
MARCRHTAKPPRDRRDRLTHRARHCRGATPNSAPFAEDGVVDLDELSDEKQLRYLYAHADRARLHMTRRA